MCATSFLLSSRKHIAYCLNLSDSSKSPQIPLVRSERLHLTLKFFRKWLNPSTPRRLGTQKASKCATVDKCNDDGLPHATPMVTDLNSLESEPGSAFLLTDDLSMMENPSVKEVEVIPEIERGGAEIC
uniref:Uncharacterized protein n=1 Tax=Opuntia streptacantha TaxID=393608 RepID=A0A7C9DTA7_OPUST